MSKSKGNVHTLQDVFDREGRDVAGAFRYLIASGHYRNSLDFTFGGLDAAQRTLRNLTEARTRFERAAAGAEPSDFAEPWARRFRDCMNDDLDTPGALAALHEGVGAANRAAQEGSLAPADAAASLALLDLAGRVLGIFLHRPARRLSPEQQRIVDARAAARAARDWAEADRLRAVLAADGVLVKDTPAGQEVTFA
jgi:cysteinyl-tRNA synthetase